MGYARLMVVGFLHLNKEGVYVLFKKVYIEHMLQNHLFLVISLLLGIAVMTMISNKLKLSYPILLVISGLLISLIPGVPAIVLEPDLVFLIFLPPLLYAAAWNTSWHEFWKWKRPAPRR